MGKKSRRKNKDKSRNALGEKAVANRIEHLSRRVRPETPLEIASGIKLAPVFSRDVMWPVVVLAMLAVVAPLQSVFNGFVWDDVVFTAADPVITLSGLWTIWFSPADMPSEGHYWPITYTTFWLEHKLWGLNPAGFHIVNLVLHATIVILIFRLMLRLQVPGAWLAAAIFAVHPVHVEPVVWVIGRKDLLATLFSLGMFLTWIRFMDTQRKSLWLYSLTTLLYVAGILSKSAVVAVPAALLIWHWWKQERVSARDLLWLAPIFAVGLLITYADWLLYVSGEKVSLNYSLLERALIAAQSLWFYIGKLVWPVELIVIYPQWKTGITNYFGWIFLIAAVLSLALLWFFREKIGKGPMAGILFFSAILSPTLGFIDFGYMEFSFVADRYQYLASLGIIGLFASVVAVTVRKIADKWQIGVRVACGAVLGVLCFLSWQQTLLYRDGVSLFQYIVTHYPQARGAYHNLAGALVAAERYEEGVEAGQLAMKYNEQLPGGYIVTAQALIQLKRYEEAEVYLRQALQIEKDETDASILLAEILRVQSRNEEALPLYRIALKQQNQPAGVILGIAEVLFELKQYEEALKYYTILARLNSSSVFAHKMVGQTLLFLEEYDKAQAKLEFVLSLQAEEFMLASAHVLMAQLFEKKNQTDKIVDHYERALNFDPNLPEALVYLANHYSKQERYADAIKLLDRLLEIEPENASLLTGRGIAYSRLDQYDKALENLQQAIKLDSSIDTARKEIATINEILRNSTD